MTAGLPLTRGETAILVVDVQNDFCHSEGALARLGCSVVAVQESVQHLVRFLDAARDRGIPIIFIRTHHDVWTDSRVWKARKLYDPANMICQTGSWGAEFFAVQPDPDEYVVTKHRYSAFVDTNLDLVLRSLNIRNLVVVGYTTNVCVESTVRSAAMQDYAVTVVRECTAALTPAEHEGALYNVATYFGQVLTAAEVLSYWPKGEL